MSLEITYLWFLAAVGSAVALIMILILPRRLLLLKPARSPILFFIDLVKNSILGAAWGLLAGIGAGLNVVASYGAYENVIGTGVSVDLIIGLWLSEMLIGAAGGLAGGVLPRGRYAAITGMAVSLLAAYSFLYLTSSDVAPDYPTIRFFGIGAISGATGGFLGSRANPSAHLSTQLPYPSSHPLTHIVSPSVMTDKK